MKAELYKQIIKKQDELIIAYQELDNVPKISYWKSLFNNMGKDYLKGLGQCAIHDIMHSYRPKERARNCPNCGELHWDSELNYSSTKRIDVDSGSYISTLYRVCRKCAERHGA